MKPSHAYTLVAVTLSAGIGLTTGAYLLARPSYDTLNRVVDGDTLEVNGQRVRLWGIDAPELAQTCPGAYGEPAPAVRDINGHDVAYWRCGKAAKEYLESFFKLQTRLQCKPVEDWVRKTTKDPYGRTVARCDVVSSHGQRHDIGLSMVAAGYAIDAPRYSQGHYAQAMQHARDGRLGIWAGGFTSPQQWRVERKQ